MRWTLGSLLAEPRPGLEIVLKSCICPRIAAGSVVVKPVPHNVTVAGVPAKIVGEAGCAEPSRTMDQMLGAIGL